MKKKQTHYANNKWANSSKSTKPRIIEKETAHSANNKYANNKCANSSKSTQPRIIEKETTHSTLTINELIVVKLLNQE